MNGLKIYKIYFNSFALLLGVSCFFSGSALANKEYKTPPIFYGASVSPIYNSNPLMRRSDIRSIYGAETRTYIGYQGESSTSKLKTDVTAVENRYDDADFNSRDFYAKLMLEKIFQRTIFSLSGSYDYDTTRSSELTTFGREVGTGRRKYFGFEPTLAFQVTPRTTLGLGGKWQETRYESDTLNNFKVTSLASVLSHNLTPLQIATLSLQGQRYALLDNSEQYIDNLGPTLSWSYNFQPKWTLSLSAGYLGSRINGFTNENTSWEYSPTYGVSLRHEGVRSSSVYSANRTFQPYTNGTETYLTNFEISERYKINPTFDLELKGNYIFAEDVPKTTDNLEKAWGGTASINYKIGINWVANLSYKYRSEDVANQDETADQQIIRVGISYKFGSL